MDAEVTAKAKSHDHYAVLKYDKEYSNAANMYWAIDAIQYTAALKLLVGKPDGIFGRNHQISSSESAQAIYNFVGNEQNKNKDARCVFFLCDHELILSRTRGNDNILIIHAKIL
ncbi:hypothetical protein [Paenibacillus sp. sgz302251]|uniref:hypothetical protein n=1 Tax=Paenibacillus sp. sgz302251 TaxID=3414493 RepID=UPI003C7AE774